MTALQIIWNLLRELGQYLLHLPRRLFGSRNERIVKRLSPSADRVELLEDPMRRLTPGGEDFDVELEKRAAALPRPDERDADAVRAHQRALQDLRVELSAPMRERAADLAKRLAAGTTIPEVREEAMALLREASRRAQAHRHFHCQLIGGRVLYEGKIAEMRTGEGKTIVCHLAALLKILQGQKVHIVTVNDYLVKRDAEFAAPIFELLGYTVGYIQAMVDPGGAEGLRRQAYACNITYGTASEFGFDYLRDNMKTRLSDQVMGALDFAIIDEVDSILIDEARTPLIISGPARDDVTRYARANRVAEELVHRQDRWDRGVRRTVSRFDGDARNIEKLADAMNILGYGGKKIQRLEPVEGEEEVDAEQAALGPDFLTDDHVEAIQAYEAEMLQLPVSERYRRYFICDIERKQAHLTHDGVTVAQELLEMGSLYAGQNMEWPHLIENALRAHKVYQKDRDYVVQEGKVIIVDTFTGRLMHGRQWSDGLHQAVEARERVTVKEETQTLATITIQNFFKLYKSIAGMTGTASTEANEFMKIYKLDVVEIPTNRPVNRVDHNDKVYRSIDHKYRAIVDEIYEVHRRGRAKDPFLMYDVFQALRPIKQRLGQSTDKLDAMMARGNRAVKAEGGVDSDKTLVDDMLALYDEEMGELVRGRPILVGTTSVENSEKLSRMLTRTYGIEHEVLNAKQHAREADIVAKGGQLHAGGRDGRQMVGNVTIATNMAGRGTDIKLALPVVYPTCRVPQTLPQGSEPSDLYPVGVTKCCIHCEEYDPATRCAHCFKPKLDPRFPELGRNVCAINVPCGLHIVGTERHESRRIDNQLRGRSGRQGDPGSSRFFLSLEDDLLKLFMGPWMLKMLEKYGFTSAGGSLEARQLTKGIQKAQTKVEEKNFMIRKGLLDWDEPKDYQRREFYKHRQQILEGRNLRLMVLAMIRKTVDTEVGRILAPAYPRKCAAEWVRSQLDIAVDEEVVDLDDVPRAMEAIRDAAREEAHDQIRTSLGEYIDPEEGPQDWDVGGLARWAERSFKLSITQNQWRKMSPQEIEDALLEAADRSFDHIPLDGLARFADESFALDQLVEWAKNKFNVSLPRAELTGRSKDEVADLLYDRVEQTYGRREVEYPVQNCLEYAYSSGQPGSAPAGEVIVRWVNEKFDQGWTLAQTEGKTPQEMYDTLLKLNEDYLINGRLREEIRAKTEGMDRPAAAEWARKRFRSGFNPARFAESDGDLVGALETEGREWLRFELTKLEQFMLLRIHDQAWKDHLLELDHLEHAIRQRPLGGDQTHPQSQFAIEGRELFSEMWNRVNDRITDLIFRVRAAPAAAAGAPTAGTGPGAGTTMTFMHQDATNAAFAAGSADQAAAMRAQNVEQKVETIRRQQPRVGRNDPCPCGSGKKYKQCCGKGA